MSALRRRIATVIATLDERENLEPLVERLSETLHALPEVEWEPVFVVAGDDGSVEYLERVGGLKVIRQRGHGGLAEAFRAGFAAVDAGVDVVATMDGDLSHRPEDLPRLLTRLEARRADIVIGSRWIPGAVVDSRSTSRSLTSRLANRLIGYLFGDQIRDRTSGYRVYRRSRLGELPVVGAGFSFLPAMVVAAERGGMRIVEEPIAFDRRYLGRSKLPIVATALGYLRLAIRKPRRYRAKGQTTARLLDATPICRRDDDRIDSERSDRTEFL